MVSVSRPRPPAWTCDSRDRWSYVDGRGRRWEVVRTPPRASWAVRLDGRVLDHAQGTPRAWPFASMAREAVMRMVLSSAPRTTNEGADLEWREASG